MSRRDRYVVGLSVLIVLTALLGARVLAVQTLARYQYEEHDQSPPATKPAEIFCLTKSAGQLCTHGSAEVLKLEGPKKERWHELADQYNKAVDAATKQLLRDARATLSPEEFAIVEKWFENSVNAQLNRQLLAPAR